MRLTNPRFKLVKLFFLLFFMNMLFLSTASGKGGDDVIWLINGDKLSGSIKTLTDDKVSILLFGTLEIEIPRSKIKRWVLSHHKESKSNSKVNNKDYYFRSSGELNVNIKSTDKKNDNINFNVSVEATEKSSRLGLDGKFQYEKRDGTTKKHNYNLSPYFDLFWGAKFFSRNTIGLQYDLLEGNYLSLDYNTGIGYQFWNDRTGQLEFIALIGLRQAYFNEELTQQFLGTDTLNYPTSTVLWNYNKKIHEDIKMDFFTKGYLLKYLHKKSNLHLKYEANASIGLRFYLTEHVYLSLSSELEYQRATLDGVMENIDFNMRDWQHLIKLGANY